MPAAQIEYSLVEAHKIGYGIARKVVLEGRAALGMTEEEDPTSELKKVCFQLCNSYQLEKRNKPQSFEATGRTPSSTEPSFVSPETDPSGEDFHQTEAGIEQSLVATYGITYASARKIVMEARAELGISRWEDGTPMLREACVRLCQFYQQQDELDSFTLKSPDLSCLTRKLLVTGDGTSPVDCTKNSSRKRSRQTEDLRTKRETKVRHALGLSTEPQGVDSSSVSSEESTASDYSRGDEAYPERQISDAEVVKGCELLEAKTCTGTKPCKQNDDTVSSSDIENFLVTVYPLVDYTRARKIVLEGRAELGMTRWEDATPELIEACHRLCQKYILRNQNDKTSSVNGEGFHDSSLLNFKEGGAPTHGNSCKATDEPTELATSASEDGLCQKQEVHFEEQRPDESRDNLKSDGVGLVADRMTRKHQRLAECVTSIAHQALQQVREKEEEFQRLEDQLNHLNTYIEEYHRKSGYAKKSRYGGVNLQTVFEDKSTTLERSSLVVQKPQGNFFCCTSLEGTYKQSQKEENVGKITKQIFVDVSGESAQVGSVSHLVQKHRQLAERVANISHAAFQKVQEKEAGIQRLQYQVRHLSAYIEQHYPSWHKSRQRVEFGDFDLLNFEEEGTRIPVLKDGEKTKPSNSIDTIDGSTVTIPLITSDDLGQQKERTNMHMQEKSEDDSNVPPGPTNDSVSEVPEAREGEELVRKDRDGGSFKVDEPKTGSETQSISSHGIAEDVAVKLTQFQTVSPRKPQLDPPGRKFTVETASVSSDGSSAQLTQSEDGGTGSDDEKKSSSESTSRRDEGTNSLTAPETLDGTNTTMLSSNCKTKDTEDVSSKVESPSPVANDEFDDEGSDDCLAYGVNLRGSIDSKPPKVVYLLREFMVSSNETDKLEKTRHLRRSKSAKMASSSRTFLSHREPRMPLKRPAPRRSHSIKPPMPPKEILVPKNPSVRKIQTVRSVRSLAWTTSSSVVPPGFVCVPAELDDLTSLGESHPFSRRFDCERLEV